MSSAKLREDEADKLTDDAARALLLESIREPDPDDNETGREFQEMAYGAAGNSTAVGIYGLVGAIQLAQSENTDPYIGRLLNAARASMTVVFSRLAPADYVWAICKLYEEPDDA